MQYQLPNGKVVYLTIEEYLNLTDHDIQYLMAINYGEYIHNPFHGSAIGRKAPISSTNDDDIIKSTDDDDLTNIDLNNLDDLDNPLK